MVSQRVFADSNLDPRFRAGLVGHWIGGGSGLTWFDRSGYGNHGALVGGPSWTLGEGGSRHALAIDGVNDYVTTGSGVIQSSTAITWSLRFKSNGLPDSTSTYVMSTNVGGVSGNDLYLYQAGGGAVTIRFQIIDGYGNWLALAPSPSVESGWHLVTLTQVSAGATPAIYVDGAPQVVTVAFAGTGTRPSNRLLVGRGDSGGYFNGLIDDVRIYNRILSPAEITVLAAASFSPIV